MKTQTSSEGRGGVTVGICGAPSVAWRAACKTHYVGKTDRGRKGSVSDDQQELHSCSHRTVPMLQAL
jgi:hypothetical protein